MLIFSVPKNKKKFEKQIIKWKPQHFYNGEFTQLLKNENVDEIHFQNWNDYNIASNLQL